MPIHRRTMKFLIPLNINSLGRTDLTGRAIVPLYINPESFNIQDGKLLSESITKGGYVIQYWGEKLGELQVSGTTGSGGIEAINILRGIYRNEITQMNNILLKRAVLLENESVSASNGVQGLGSGIESILDNFSNGSASSIKDGISSVIDEVVDAASGVSNVNSSVELIPTLGAFATNMILYWHGEKFTGFFKSFKVDESASSPGIFSYQFSFAITKRTGTRKNFMPWHKNPTDNNGKPIPAQIGGGSNIDRLSFQTSTQQRISRVQQGSDKLNPAGIVTSSFNNTQDATNSDSNRVSISRNGKLKGR